MWKMATQLLFWEIAEEGCTRYDLHAAKRIKLTRNAQVEGGKGSFSLGSWVPTKDCYYQTVSSHPILPVENVNAPNMITLPLVTSALSQQQVHLTCFAQVFLDMCFMWLKTLHRGSGGRLKSLHTAVVSACSSCRMSASSSCGGALPAHNCDSLAGVLGSPGRGTHLHFSICPGEQHGEWRPAVRPVAGAPLCHDPVNGKSNTIPSTEELKALDIQTNCWQERGRQGNCTLAKPVPGSSCLPVFL